MKNSQRWFDQISEALLGEHSRALPWQYMLKWDRWMFQVRPVMSMMMRSDAVQEEKKNRTCVWLRFSDANVGRNRGGDEWAIYLLNTSTT
jgi:hypothetical protein